MERLRVCAASAAPPAAVQSVMFRSIVPRPIPNSAALRSCARRFAVLLLYAAGGCAASSKPLFRERDPNLSWPAAPSAARIWYVGSLASADDLRRRKTVLEVIGEALAGQKPVEALYGPRRVVVTPDGTRVWVADTGGRCLFLFDLERRTVKRIQKLGGAPLFSPVGMCLGPGDSLFVCDSQTGAIHHISDRDGSLLSTLHSPEDLLRPVALAYDADADELWVVDALAHDVKVLGGDGSLQRIVGRRGTGPGEFNYPCDLAISANAVWIAEAGNHRVQAVSRDGSPITSFGRAGDAPGDLALPKGIARDSDGHVYVVDGRFENVQVFDSAGRLLLFFGAEGTREGEFWLPGGVFIEASGRIWVCDTYNRRIQIFQYVSDEEAALSESREREAHGP